jgi:type I phosphodiesterase/nucleotide pyrophosphatase
LWSRRSWVRVPPVTPRTRLGSPDLTERSFAAVPDAVFHALTGEGTAPFAEVEGPYDRVVLILLDAFGRRALERHAGHPFVQRFERDGVILPLRAQFPSTTTAHITTLHTGSPVGEHGLYEWNMYEPTIGRVICPLLFSYAEDGARESLRDDGIDPSRLFPFETLHQRLAAHGVGTGAFSDADFTPSTYSDRMLRGASHVVPTIGLPHAAVAAGRWMSGPAPQLTYIYESALDTIGHLFGPTSDEYDAQADAILTTLERQLMPLLPRTGSTLMLLTTDHGQTPIDPAGTVLVNEACPGVVDHLRAGADGRPLLFSGSARDLFLHVEPDHLAQAQAELSSALDGVADVRPADELIAEGLFGETVAEPLRMRIAGSIVLLPHAGRAVWWREPGRFDRPMTHRGLHGGLSDDEMLTFLAAIRL